MSFSFFIVGAVCALLLIVNNVVRTLLAHKRIRFSELALAFLAFCLLLAGLLADNLRSARFDLQEQMTLLVVIPLLITSLALIVVEVATRRRLRQSRGVLGVGMALMLLAAAFSYNIVSLVIEQSSTSLVRRPTPVNSTPSYLDPCSQEAIGSQATASFFALISQETGLTRDELADRFAADGSLSVAALVRANGRNPQALIDQLNAYIDELLLNLVADRCIPPIARPLALSQIEPIIADAVYDNFDTLIQGLSSLGGQSAAPGPATLPPAALESTRRALIAQIPTIDIRPTATPTLTPTITPTPSPTTTRTPLPTLTPSPTRQRFATATPTATATLANPCQATADFNVNLRDFPALEGTTVLLRIPFASVFDVFAPNEGRTWWYAEYEGQRGWVSDEFISVTGACYDLAPRAP